MRKYQIIVALALIVLAVMMRVVPHPANFAPVAAVAIFGGAVLPKRYTLLLPLAVMVISDSLIGWYSIMPVTWACYVLIALASSKWLRGRGFGRGVAMVIGSSLFFFVVTNFAVWAQGGLYPRTLAGLASCYYMAVPFFRNTALSDLIYSGLLFGIYALAVKLGAKLFQDQPEQRIV